MMSFLFFSLIDTHAQQIRIAAFKETVLVIFDQQISQKVIASITLQSTSNQEIGVPSELDKKIRENDRIVSVILTNEQQCILGVQDDACILVNISRDESEKGIIAIQDAAKETNLLLETSGAVSGKGIVSTVYTMPREDTNSMYEKISSILVYSKIRESGGFFDVAKKLSSERTAAMTFSILPKENPSLYQIKLSVDYPLSESNKDCINPLKFLKTNELKRSDLFHSDDFYPLNSILQVLIVSSESTNVNEVNTNIIPSEIIGGEKIPTDLSVNGWFFDPESGNIIDGKYLFGEKFSVNKNELVFTLGSTQIDDCVPAETLDYDSSLLIVIIIVILAGGAAVFYLKGYKKG